MLAGDIKLRWRLNEVELRFQMFLLEVDAISNLLWTISSVSPAWSCDPSGWRPISVYAK